VYRDDGQGFTQVGDVQVGTGIAGSVTGPGVKSIEVTDDGRLRIVDGDDKEFYFGAGKSKDARLMVQNDGNVVLYGGDGRVLWASDTQRK